MLYSVEIRDFYGRLVTVLDRPQSKQFTLYRNRSGSCQFTLDLYDPQAIPDNLALNQYDIVFRRQGTVVFAGQISYIHPLIDDNDRKQVEVIATGYFDLLDQRYIYSDYPTYDSEHQQVSFSNIDAGQICWDVINYSQFPLSSDGSVLMQGTSPTLNQSFIAAGTANVKTIKLLLKNTSATGNLIVGLYTDSSGSSGSLIANSQKTIAVSGISSSFAWYEIDYSTLPALTNGTTYWIKAYLDTTQSGSNGISWAYLNSNYYLDGKAYSPENINLFTSTQDLQFFILLDDNSFQMTKNTYLGLTQGTIATSYNLSPVFSEYKKIKSCIEDMSSTYVGLDFNITVSIDSTTNHMTKQFNVFYPRQGVDNMNLDFIYPGNIKKLDRPKDGKSMINEVAMRGQGFGLDQLVSVQIDTSSMQTYGQRQDVEHQADVTDTGTLSSLGQELIRVRKDPLDLPVVVLDGLSLPQLGSYGIGDTILVQVSGAPMLNFTNSYRIEQIDVTVSDDDQEVVSLTLSQA